MSEPLSVRIKRRADEAGLDVLILESSSRSKRAKTPLRYVRASGNGEFAVGSAVAGMKGGTGMASEERRGTSRDTEGLKAQPRVLSPNDEAEFQRRRMEEVLRDMGEGLRRMDEQSPRRPNPDYIAIADGMRGEELEVYLRTLSPNERAEFERQRMEVELEKLSSNYAPEEKTTTEEPAKRLFRLNKRKAVGDDVGVATFIEKKARRQVGMETSVHENDNGGMENGAGLEAPMERPLKPPSKRARVTMPVNKKTSDPETEAERARMSELAKYAQQAAAEEIKREQQTSPIARTETKPTKITPPRLSPQKSRALHQQRIATNNTLPATKDIELDDDTGYVYDTYVLARTSDLGAVGQSSLGNVGYLVITEEDESLWQSYLEDEVSEEEGDSADEDENAEDFYGADYPEDELEADDEFGVNAYGYRGGLPEDEEEWDEETGEYSEDEGLEGRMERLMMRDGGDYQAR